MIGSSSNLIKQEYCKGLETIGKSLPEKGFVESVDKKSGETLFVDEEQEVVRSKTIRFF